MTPIFVIAKYHDQPPCETPAKITRLVHPFSADTRLTDVVAWARENAEGRGQLVRLTLEQSA